MALCLVGGASVSALPLTSGFVTKSMVIAAAGHEHLEVVWHLLMLASAGAFLYAGIRLPYIVFFSKDRGLRPEEPPLNMRLGMGLLALLSIVIGVFPSLLYRILPYRVDFTPYAAGHVLGQLQIIAFSALAFFVLMRFMRPVDLITIDTDWFYRMGARGFIWLVYHPFTALGRWGTALFFERVPSRLTALCRNPLAVMKMAFDMVVMGFSGEAARSRIERRINYEKGIYPGDIIKHWPIGSTVLYVTIFLLACLLIYYR